FFFQAEDGIRDKLVTGVQTCALPILLGIEARCAVALMGGEEAVHLGEMYPAQQVGIGRVIVAAVGRCARHRRVHGADAPALPLRSEERRVGKEWRCQWWPEEWI